MRTLLDTTLRRERSAPELREALATIHTEVERLSALSIDLLDRAALDQTDFAREPIDVPKMVREAVDGVRPLTHERGIELETSVVLERATLRAVPVEVRRALDNLLSNAVKFAPRGSTVRVEASLQNDRVRFLVTDEGDGVPEAERETIFEPFQRGQSAVARGAGLGLAIVRDIARRHGGEAWVESTSERPSGFAFDLPVSAPSKEGLA
jgi:signal transduction histidine kinase